MPETLTISDRGQITLPAHLRDRLGIGPGDRLTVEHRNGELVFKPTAVLPFDSYSDEQIALWDREDALDDNLRTRIWDQIVCAAS